MDKFRKMFSKKALESFARSYLQELNPKKDIKDLEIDSPLKTPRDFSILVGGSFKDHTFKLFDKFNDNTLGVEKMAAGFTAGPVPNTSGQKKLKGYARQNASADRANWEQETTTMLGKGKQEELKARKENDRKIGIHNQGNASAGRNTSPRSNPKMDAYLKEESSGSGIRLPSRIVDNRTPEQLAKAHQAYLEGKVDRDIISDKRHNITVPKSVDNSNSQLQVKAPASRPAEERITEIIKEEGKFPDYSGDFAADLGVAKNPIQKGPSNYRKNKNGTITMTNKGKEYTVSQREYNQIAQAFNSGGEEISKLYQSSEIDPATLGAFGMHFEKGEAEGWAGKGNEQHFNPRYATTENEKKVLANKLSRMTGVSAQGLFGNKYYGNLVNQLSDNVNSSRPGLTVDMLRKIFPSFKGSASNFGGYLGAMKKGLKTYHNTYTGGDSFLNLLKDQKDAKNAGIVNEQARLDKLHFDQFGGKDSFMNTPERNSAMQTLRSGKLLEKLLGHKVGSPSSSSSSGIKWDNSIYKK